jgi:hypothetical protein
VRLQQISSGAAREQCDKSPLFADRVFKASAYAFLFNRLAVTIPMPPRIHARQIFCGVAMDKNFNRRRRELVSTDY